MTNPTRSQIEAVLEAWWDAQDRNETQYDAAAHAIIAAERAAWSSDMRTAPKNGHVLVEDTGGKVEIVHAVNGLFPPMSRRWRLLPQISIS
jgi:hypothetical protein